MQHLSHFLNAHMSSCIYAFTLHTVTWTDCNDAAWSLAIQIHFRLFFLEGSTSTSALCHLCKRPPSYLFTNLPVMYHRQKKADFLLCLQCSAGNKAPSFSLVLTLSRAQQACKETVRWICRLCSTTVAVQSQWDVDFNCSGPVSALLVTSLRVVRKIHLRSASSIKIAF